MKPCRLKVIRDTDITYPEGNCRTAGLAAQYLRDNIFPKEEAWRENAYVLTLDNNLNVTGVLHLSMGGPSNTTFDERLMVKTALDTFSRNILVAHNHPSGSPVPGKADIETTKNIKRAVNAFGINLIDHIILGDDTFYSFDSETVKPY